MTSKQLPLIGYSAAAELLGIPKGTLYWWVSQGSIPFVRFGPRTVRFDPATIQRGLADLANRQGRGRGGR